MLFLATDVSGYYNVDTGNTLVVFDQLSRRAMQRLIQRLLRKLTTLGQYEESLATTSAAAAIDRPVALKSKQQLVRRDDCVLNLCDDPFIFAQQLTHIEMVSEDELYFDWLSVLGTITLMKLLTFYINQHKNTPR